MWKWIAVPVTMLVIGFAGGWFGYQQSQLPPKAEQADVGPPAPSLVPKERQKALPSNPQDSTHEDLVSALQSGRYKARELLAALAKTDPEAAYDLLNKAPSRFRRRFLLSLYGPWVLQDQHAALAAAAQEPKELLNLLYEHLGEVLSKRDPEEALQLGKQLVDGAPRNRFLTAVMDTLFLEDPIDACRRLADFPGARPFSPSRLYYESGMDPPDLSPDLMDAMVHALPPDRRNGILHEIFREYWMNSEIEEARAWAFNLPEGSLRDQVTEEILWSDSYSDKHFADLEEMNLTPDERVRLMVNRSAYKATQDPLGGLQAAREIQDPVAQRLAERSVYGTWINNDPAAAIEFLSTESPSDLHYFSSEIATVLSDSTPQQAIASALDIAAVSEDANILTHVFENVAEEDLALAKAQLSEIPPGHHRDAGITGILQSLSESSQRTSLDWALSIGDAELRTTQAAEQLSAWANKDLSGAQAWLEQATLEPEMHSELTERLSNIAVRDPRRSRSVSSSFGTMTVYY